MALFSNELIFIGYILVVSMASIMAARFGKEALFALIGVETVLMNIFVLKQITLFGFTATASDALAVGATLGLNLLQDISDKKTALKAIRISFFCAIFYVLITLLHISYGPAASDVTSRLFRALLLPTPRIIIASLCVYAFVQNIDAFLYGYLKKHYEHSSFVIRNYTSLLISQLIDTILFTFLGLYGISEGFSNIRTLVDIMIVSYTIKVLIILIAVPFVRFAKSFIPAPR
jgi:uncharacterized integral membrane protein (TIGR00697 family)